MKSHSTIIKMDLHDPRSNKTVRLDKIGCCMMCNSQAISTKNNCKLCYGFTDRQCLSMV